MQKKSKLWTLLICTVLCLTPHHLSFLVLSLNLQGQLVTYVACL